MIEKRYREHSGTRTIDLSCINLGRPASNTRPVPSMACHALRQGIAPGRLSDIWPRGIAASWIDTPLEFGYMNCCLRQRMIRCYWIPSPLPQAPPTYHPSAAFRGRIAGRSSISVRLIPVINYALST